LKSRINSVRNSRKTIEAKDHNQESWLGRKEDRHQKVVSLPVRFEFINVVLHGHSTVVVAQDFQRGVGAIGDKSWKGKT
jgi:hypothetical protein